MKKWTNRFKLGIILTGMVLFLAGCMGPTIYQKAGIIGGGYRDKKLGDGSYEVYFIASGRNFDFAKLGGLYRAAEITYENKYHYFSVTKVQDKSQDQTMSNGYGGFQHIYIPIILLNIQCYSDRPATGYDAYNYLNTTSVPGTKELDTVADRRADAKAGN